MNVHEYQAKQLLAEHGVPVPGGKVAGSAADAGAAARAMQTSRWAVKAQIYAGGRGDGHFADDPDGPGGVRFADSPEEVERHARAMLGKMLITSQTGGGGREVERVYVEPALALKQELYLSMLVDRETSRVTLVSSARGGINIEKVAREAPRAINKHPIDPLTGLDEDSARTALSGLRLEPGPLAEVARVATAMYTMFTSLDASLIEINPLAVTDDGGTLALDAVVAFDDNALFRQPQIEALRDAGELRLGELEASHHGLNYVKLDGNIGCMASGAGLAMATIDALSYLGGRAANFLDVPPVTQVARIKDAFKLLLTDPGVESVLVNIFGGGIMRCDNVADGILLANREVPLRVPMIVRLAGTNANLGIQRLRDSGPPVVFATDLADAAEKAVAAARETQLSSRKTWWQRTQRLLQGN